MKKLLFLLLLIPSALIAQKLPDYGFYKARIAGPDSMMVAELLPVYSMPRKAPGLLYYWYTANTIHATQGSYSGKLLNGTYNAYYPDKSLKSQGQFRKGLKNGVWRSWNEKGMLKTLYTWKEGIRNGPYQLFDGTGALTASGEYKHGILVTSDKRPLWKRLNIFKKRKE